jgi:hypothetical protein
MDVLNKKLKQVRQAYERRNSEIRKIMNGKLKQEHFLTTQEVFDARVMEFLELVNLYNDFDCRCICSGCGADEGDIVRRPVEVEEQQEEMFGSITGRNNTYQSK